MAEHKQETPRLSQPCSTCGCDGTIEGRHNRELLAAAKAAKAWLDGEIIDARMAGVMAIPRFLRELSKQLESAITNAEQPEGK